MIDITKEDFLREGYIEFENVSKKKSKIKNWISKKKFLTIAIGFYFGLSIVNLALVYYFFKMLV